MKIIDRVFKIIVPTFDCIFLHKLYELSGLSRKSVLIRTIWSWSICTLFLGSFLCYVGLEWRISESFMMAFIGWLAMFWAFYQNFHREFVSKYLRLAKIHDENLINNINNTVEHLILSDNMSKDLKTLLSKTHLNFAEDCKIYNMQKEKSFYPMFNSIIEAINESFSFDSSGNNRNYFEKNLPALFKYINELNEQMQT